MQQPAIVFRNVWKSYPSYHHVTGGIKNFLFHLPQAIRDIRQRRTALEDISFEIPRGTKFGFVGKNGAGKSTTLGLIAGVLSPDKGSVEVNGRVSPLLELGAGFHPEMTGRENIMLNGVLLGLTRAEVREFQDRIIDYSELGEFIDQPVRTYSSGMFAKLGFAVVSILKPDILLLDEILSVGDEGFKNKTTAKFKEFQEDPNITMILVSHALESVAEICDQAAWIENKSLRMLGPASDVVREYKASTMPKVAVAAAISDDGTSDDPEEGESATSGHAPAGHFTQETILIAGADAVVRSALERQLRSAGYEKLVFLDETKTDVADLRAVSDFMQEIKPFCTFFIADGCCGGQDPSHSPAEAAGRLLSALQHIPRAAQAAGTKRFFFIGGSRGLTPAGLAAYPAALPGQDERTCGVLQLIGIELCKALNRQYGTRYLTVAANVYGPGERISDNPPVIAELMEKMRDAGDSPTVTLSMPECSSHEFIYSDDFAAACVLLMEAEEEMLAQLSDGEKPPLVHIGSRPVRAGALARLTAEITGYPGAVAFSSPHVPDVAGQDALPGSEVLYALGWRQNVSLRDGMQRLYDSNFTPEGMSRTSS